MDFLKGVICGIFICPIISVMFGITVRLIKEAFKKDENNDTGKTSTKCDS